MSKWDSVINATGSRGNIFEILGRATRLLRDIGDVESIDPLRASVLNSNSYSEALSCVREYFRVVTDDEIGDWS